MAEKSFQELLNSGDLIRPDELARGMKVAPGTVYAWVERGLIPHIRLGKCIRFDPVEVRDWYQKKRNASRKAPGGGSTHTTT